MYLNEEIEDLYFYIDKTKNKDLVYNQDFVRTMVKIKRSLYLPFILRIETKCPNVDKIYKIDLNIYSAFGK